MATQLPFEQNAFRVVSAQGSAQAAPTPWIQGIGESGEAARKDLEEFTGRLVALEDFSAQQKAAYDISVAQQLAQEKLDAKMALPDGAPESFFEADGSARRTKMQNFLYAFRKDIDKVAKLGVLPKTQAKIQSAAQSALLDMSKTLIASGIHKQQKIALNNLNNNYRLAMEQNRWEDAAALAMQGEEAGLYKPGEGQLLAFRARKDGVRSSFESLLDSDPQEAGKMLYSDKLDEFFTANEKTNMRKQLQKRREAVARSGLADNDAPQWILKGDASPTGKARRKAAETPELTGFFTPQEIMWHKALQSGGNPDQIRKQVLQQAIAEAQAFDPSVEPEAAMDEFVQRYLQYKSGGKSLFSGEQLQRIYKNGRSTYDKSAHVGIRVTDRLDNLGRGMQLVNEKWWATAQQHCKEGGKYYKEFSETIDLASKLDPEMEVRQAVLRRHIEENKTKILEEYNQWRESKEGQEANTLEQTAYFLRCVEKATGNKKKSIDKKTNEYHNEIINNQKDIFNRFNEDNPRTYTTISFPTEESPLPEPVVWAAGYADPTRELKEDEILLPKSMMGGVEPGKTVVELQYDNKHVRYFTVAGECEGDIALQSHKLGLQGFDTKKTLQVNMRFLTPESGSQKTKLQKAVLGSAAAADRIFESEARRDANGRLAVYRPPAGDGSDYEVAGINSQSHPREAQRLMRLIEGGQHDKAQNEAKRYIQEYTEPAVKPIKEAGLPRSAGVEYLLRDIYFNSGKGGYDKVLNRALGLPDHADPERRLEALKQVRSAKDLAEALTRERVRFYHNIARSNPAKAKFLRGWMNRAAGSYRDAIAMS